METRAGRRKARRPVGRNPGPAAGGQGKRPPRKMGCPPLRIRVADLRVLDPIIGNPKLRRAIEADEDLYVALVKLGYKRERLLIEKELHEFPAKA